MTKGSILIVEDSQLVNRHLQLCLERSGYAVWSALNPTEALEHIGSVQFDIALLDVMLNDTIDGIELGEIISQQYDFPIIYLTALSDSKTLGRALITRPYSLLNKPFKEPELLNNIEVALNKSRFENEIRRNRDFLATVLDVIHESVIVLSEKMEIQYINPAAELQLGVHFGSVHLMPIDQVLLVSNNTKQTAFKDFMDFYSRIDDVENDLIYVTSHLTDIKLPIESFTVKKFFNFATGAESFLFLFRDITEQLEKEKVVKELRAKNLSLLIEGQEMERVRFSKDVHDGLGQILNVIKLKVDLLSISSEEKHETLFIVDEAIKEVKRIANNLLPSLLSDFDLVTCIQYLSNQYNSNEGGPKINIEAGDVPEIDLNCKINCFRVIQECLNNAINHGKSDNISIQIYGVNKNLQITIEDNGIGFEPKKADSKTNHHGLKIIKQRVESLQGELLIESNQKMGTMIHVSIPIAGNTTKIENSSD